MDSARISDIYSLSVTHQIFDGLVRFDHTLTISPALAQVLGRLFSAGWPHVDLHTPQGGQVPSRPRGDRRRRRLFAHANSRPKTQSGAADLFTSIKGAQDFVRGRARVVSGLSAPDRYTVQVVLNEALTPFVSVLAVGHAKIVPRDLVEQQGEGFGSFSSFPNGWSVAEAKAGTRYFEV